MHSRWAGCRCSAHSWSPPSWAGQASSRHTQQSARQTRAGKIAVERYGGKALSVSSDGDYLIVRLRLSDGRVIDVAVDRWSC